MATIKEIWDSISQLVDDGISIIPVRDREEIVGDKTYGKKSPYDKWKKYQEKRATHDELWFLLEKYNTTAIATITGRVSGNLEGIDIDVKWHTSIPEILFKEIEQISPELYAKIRINKTPSGGYHILYRVAGEFVVPGNKKLAGRPATDEEIKINPNEKLKYFIETRGESGYLVAPPSLDYSVYRDVPIPVISVDERDLLINICQSFNEITHVPENYSATKSESQYYEVSPFDSYNQSASAETVLVDNGWSKLYQNNRAIYFSKPGSKSKGIHAAFLFRRRLFYFFTTQSQFDNRCYHPATVRAVLQMGGDKKSLFKVLVAEGHGTIRKSVETSLVKSAAISNKQLPANLSDEGRATYESIAKELKIKTPYGIFWEINDKGKFEISRERLYEVSAAHGFRLYKDSLVRVVGRFVHAQKDREYFDLIKDYIHDSDPVTKMDILNCYEAFVERHGKFTISRIMQLNDDLIVKDTRTHCHKFYKNGYVLIDKDGAELRSYESLEGLILANKIQTRDFVIGRIDGKYVDFLNKSVRYDDRNEYIEKIIGFLSHDYKDETTGYLIVQTEECPDPKDGGGSGKNLFVKMLKNTTTVLERDGETVQLNEKLLQPWNGERLMVISDVPKNFNYMFFKDLSTNDGTLKKLFKDETQVPCSDMCKFVFNSNYGYSVSDGGLARRIIPIEFTSFFTLAKGVDIYYGCNFPGGWDDQDWIGFDNLVVKSVQQWIGSGLKLYPGELSEGGTLKQFEQTHGKYLTEFIEEGWEEWVNMGTISNDDFKKMYENWCSTNMVPLQYRATANKINRALEAWAKLHKCGFAKDFVIRDLGGITRAKKFTNDDLPF